MNKLSIVSATIVAFVLAIMTSGCSKDLDYKKACDERDFVRAYNIVNTLRDEVNELEAKICDLSTTQSLDKIAKSKKLKEERNYAEEKYNEAYKYVVFQEAMYVLEEHGANGMMRIAGIVKEHDADWLYEELESVARKAGKNDLVEELENMDPSLIAPITTSISGPLNGYIEVVDKKYKVTKSKTNRENVINVLIKIDIKSIQNYKGRLTGFLCLDFLSENGDEVVSLIEDPNHIWEMEVGETQTVYFDIDIYDSIAKSISSFRVRFEKY